MGDLADLVARASKAPRGEYEQLYTEMGTARSGSVVCWLTSSALAMIEAAEYLGCRVAGYNHAAALRYAQKKTDRTRALLFTIDLEDLPF